MTGLPYPQLKLEKGRPNVVPVSLGVAVSATPGALRAELRTQPSESSELVATWTITVEDAAAGEITLSLPEAWADAFSGYKLYTDIIQVAGPVTLMSVVECLIEEGVTA